MFGNDKCSFIESASRTECHPSRNSLCFHLQWNPDITMFQGTGEITSLYRGIVKPGFRSIHFTVTGIGRAEKC